MSERFAQHRRLSRQPLTSLCFVLPFLFLYEVGIRVMAHPMAHSGGGVWLRGILEKNLGLPEFVIPLLPIVTLVIWQILENRPAKTPPGVVRVDLNSQVVSSLETRLGIGSNLDSDLDAVSNVRPRIPFRQRLRVLPDMLPESVLLALGLRLLLGVETWGVEWLTGSGPAFRPVDPMSLRDGVAFLISHCGAGLYEEFLFRLVLTGGLAMVLRSYLPESAAWWISIVLSSILFVAAHHIGTGGEPILWREASFQLSVVFRMSASLILGFIYWKRGFGIVVGVHTFYNLFIRIV